MTHGSMRRTRRPSPIIVVAVIAAVVVATGAAGGDVLRTRTQGSPQQTAASYLRDWQRGSYAATGQGQRERCRTAAWPPRCARPRPNSACAAFTSGSAGSPWMRIGPGPASRPPPSWPVGHTWTYPGQLQLVTRSLALVGELEPVRHLPRAPGGSAVRAQCRRASPGRASCRRRHRPELSRGDCPVRFHRLCSPAPWYAATKAQAKALGAPYQAGDLIGQGGIEVALPGAAGGQAVADHPGRGARAERVNATAARFAATPGKIVRPASTCRTRWPRRRPCRPPTPRSPLTWWPSSRPPARCWPW